jgi:hypothetical protein
MLPLTHNDRERPFSHRPLRNKTPGIPLVRSFTWRQGLSVSADDRRLMTVLGPQQDHNYMVYIYDRDKGCRWYNTQTGEVGGKWGPRGMIPAPYRFGVHDARISKSGEFVEISGGGQGRGHHECRPLR